MGASYGGQNVLDDHGADPTGATDSTGAFLRAIAALGSRGGTVTIPPGRYRLDGAPIPVHSPVCFRGALGSPRTAGLLEGSVTTLIFPQDRDGFVVEPDAHSARFENLALVRNGPGYARRGIHAKRPIYAAGLYLLRWERGIDLDGRVTHPDDPENPNSYNVNGFQVERIFAEDCRWGTYAHGFEAGGGHFLHIYCFTCEAGIYDSSTGGNGYVNCYVEQAASAREVPYYLDNQSVLFNCRCESVLPPQLGSSVQAIGGAFNVATLSPELMARLGVTGSPFRAINGIPARITSQPFPPSPRATDGKQIEVTVDDDTHIITLTGFDLSSVDVANQINAAFSTGLPSALEKLPRAASADAFDTTLKIEGWRGHRSGRVTIAGDPTALALIGFDPTGASVNALGRGQLLSQIEIANAIFRAYSGPGGGFGASEQVEVQVAYRGDSPLSWQARGTDPDAYEFSVIRLRDAHTRRWAFARASAASLSTMAFTMDGDTLGADQVVMYRGMWLQRSPSLPSVLLCNGAPDSAQGRPGDIAWDMAANPPTRYVRGASGWSAA